MTSRRNKCDVAVQELTISGGAILPYFTKAFILRKKNRIPLLPNEVKQPLKIQHMNIFAQILLTLQFDLFGDSFVLGNLGVALPHDS